MVHLRVDIAVYYPQLILSNVEQLPLYHSVTMECYIYATYEANLLHIEHIH